MVKLLKIKRRDFFQWESIPILVSRTVKTRKFKLEQRFIFYLSSTKCKQEFVNLTFLILQFDDVIVKTIKIYGS